MPTTVAFPDQLVPPCKCYNMGSQTGSSPSNCRIIATRIGVFMSAVRPKFGFILVAAFALLIASSAYAAQKPLAAKRPIKQVQPAPEPQPAPPPPPSTLEQMPTSAPQVSFHNDQLMIVANNSTLGDVLRAVRNQTGAAVEIPANATERVVGRFGPGPARDVLAVLLNGSHFN